MAESVDASVSNTDRETCAGSTPARSTRANAPQSKIVERFFFCTVRINAESAPSYLVGDDGALFDVGRDECRACIKEF